MKAFCRTVKRFFTSEQHTCINGTKGVISLFLACLMLPFAYMADLLVESGRYSEAMSMAEQAVANAEMSTLADYDEYLMNRFGLAAVSQEKDCAQAFKTNLDNSYQSMASGAKINVNAVDGTISLYEDDPLMRQVEEASKYSLPAYYAGSTVNALLDEIRDTKLGGQLDFLLEVLGSCGTIVDKVVNFVKAVRDLYRAAKKVDANAAEYSKQYSAFLTAADDLAAKKKDYETKAADWEKKKGTAAENRKAADDCKALIDAYITAVKNASIPADVKAKLTGRLGELDKATDATFDEMLGYIKEKLPADAKLSFTYKDSTVTVLYHDLPTELKKLDYAKKLESSASADKEAQAADTAAKDAHSKLQPSLEGFNTAKAAYIAAMDKLLADSKTEGSLLHYTAKLEEADKLVGETKSAFTGAIQKHATDFVKYSDADTKAWKKEKEALEKEKEGTTDETRKTEIDKKIKELDKKIDDNDSYYDNIKAGVEKGQEAFDAFTKDDSCQSLFAEAMVQMTKSAWTELKKVRDNVDALTGDSIKSDTDLRKGSYYYDLSKSYSTVNLIVEVLKALWNKLTDFDAIFEKVKSVLAVVESIYAEGGFYNKNLTAFVSSEEMDSAAFENVILNLSKFINAAEKLTFGVEDFNILTAVEKILGFFGNLQKLVDSGKALVESVKVFVGDTLSNLKGYVYDVTDGKFASKLVLSLYLLNSLPNRTNYQTGKSQITGMKFTDIARTDRDFEGTLAPFELQNMASFIHDISKQEASDKVFSGAEMEYILAGGRSEVLNQASAFFRIYALRFLIDIAPIAMNDFVQELVEALAAPTFGIGSAIVLIAYLVAEPYLDTTLLAMGNRLPIIKRPSKVYLTPEGLPTLLKEFTKVSLNAAAKEKIKQEGKKLIKDIKDGGADPEVKEEAQTEEDKADMLDAADNKSILDSIKAQYSTYLLLFSVLELPREVMLKRFKNLISLEAKEYYRAKGKSFELSCAYTYMRVDATVEFSPILPLEPISYSAFKKIDIQQSRGY